MTEVTTEDARSTMLPATTSMTDEPATTIARTTTPESTTTALDAASTDTSSSGALSGTTGALAGLVVVIDPGHNGANGSHPREIAELVDAGGFPKACNTTGTAGRDGYSETQYNWETAASIRAALVQAGAVVVMTRASNAGVGPCVDVRGAAAATVGAAALISIHADGARPAAHGFHVIHPRSSVGYTDRTAADSTRLATDLRDSLVEAGRAPANYIGSEGLDERGDLGTLNRSAAPAVTVESGNMRKPVDLSFLHSAKAKQSFAAAVVKALERFTTAADRTRTGRRG
jgi:N-acetylmuramoyl-L-alanine amidase